MACMEKLRNAYETLIRKPDGERHLGSSRQDNIKGDL
jgi:hypothetical protein